MSEGATNPVAPSFLSLTRLPTERPRHQTLLVNPLANIIEHWVKVQLPFTFLDPRLKFSSLYLNLISILRFVSVDIIFHRQTTV